MQVSEIDTVLSLEIIIMRKLFITIAVALLAISFASAQSQRTGFWADFSLSTGSLILENTSKQGTFSMQQTDYAADVVFGWRANSHLAIGAGATASCVVKSGAYSIPLFIRLHYDILDKTVSPYLNLDLGWSLAARSLVSEDLVKVADEPFYTLDCRYVEYNNPDRYYRNGFMTALSLGVAVKIERGDRLYLGVTAGTCQVTHGVTVRDSEGVVTNYSTAVKGPDHISTVLVPTYSGFLERFRPEIRFRIGYEF